MNPKKGKTSKTISLFVHVKNIDMSKMTINKETAKRELDRELIYNRAFETPIFAMTILDMNQNVVFGNVTARKIFELERDAVGVNVRDFLNEESKKLVDAVILPTLEKMGSWQGELVGKLKDGREVPLSASCVIIYDEDGKPHAILATYRDITDRKRAEEERVKAVSAAAADREKAAVIDALPHSIVVLKLDGEIISVNPAHLKMFGHKSADEIIGTGIEGFRERFSDPEKDFPKSLKLFKKIIKKGFVEEPLEIRFRRVDGKEFVGTISTSLLRDAAGNPKNIIATITDITERKRMEEEMRKNEKKLALAEKLAAIGEVATQVGHDLRNPLTSIKGAAYYLKTNKKIKFDKNAKKMFDTIDDSIAYCDKILTDLLDFSREIKLKPVRKTVKKVVADAISSIKIPKKVNVINSTQSEPTIRVDILLIRRVLHNVFTNAFEAMPKGGTLKIESKENDENVSIKICDSGVGIPKKVVKKLFTPFFTMNARGVGLGLAICKRIVEAHGGSISIKSKKGKGTCVTIILPKKQKIGVQNK